MPPVVETDDLVETPTVLHSVIDHVFLPPKLPQRADPPDRDRNVHLLLAKLLVDYAEDYAHVLPDMQQATWAHICRMLRHVGARVDMDLEKAQLTRDLAGMCPGGVYPSQRISITLNN